MPEQKEDPRMKEIIKDLHEDDEDEGEDMFALMEEIKNARETN